MLLKQKGIRRFLPCISNRQCRMYSTEAKSEVPFTLEELKQIPKAELHRHLDGSMRVSTVLELAKRNNVSLPAKSEQEMKKLLVLPDDCASLQQYLDVFKYTCSVLQDKFSLERAVFEMCEDAFMDGVNYLEIRFGPILHTKNGMSLSQVMDAVVSGVDYSEKMLPGFKSRIIVCGLRDMPQDVVYEMAVIATKYSNSRVVVAFDLAAQEMDYPASMHKKAFDLISENYLKATCHSGEAAGADYIQDAVMTCNVQRVGHGTRLYENERLLEYIRDRKIALEICVTSNYQTKAIPKFESHPLPMYFQKGVAVCICTDNTLMSDTTLSMELFKIQQVFKFSNAQMLTMIKYSFEHSFVSYPEQQELTQHFDTFVRTHVRN